MISLKMIIYKANILRWNIILIRAMVRIKFDLIITKAIIETMILEFIIYIFIIDLKGCYLEIYIISVFITPPNIYIYKLLMNLY